MANNRDNQANFGNMAGAITVIAGGLVLLYLIVLIALKIATFIGTSLSKWGAETDPEVIAVVVGVFLTYVLTNITTKVHKENLAAEQAKLRKTDLYDEFMTSLTKMLINRETQNESDDGNDMSFITNFATQIIIHGGADVIKAFREWKDAEETEEIPQTFLSADKLLLAIRKDLGVSNKGIKARDLLSCITVGGKSAIDKQIEGKQSNDDQALKS